MSVCLLSVFQSHQKSQGHEMLGLGLIWANLDHYEARFFEILISKGDPIWPSVKKSTGCRIKLSSRFPKPPKVPGSWNFGSRPNLGQLKTWRSPIFEIFIFKGAPHMVQCKKSAGYQINFVHVFRSHQKSQFHEILALSLIWAILNHYEARFSKFWFLKRGPHMAQC